MLLPHAADWREGVMVRRVYLEQLDRVRWYFARLSNENRGNGVTSADFRDS